MGGLWRYGGRLGGFVGEGKGMDAVDESEGEKLKALGDFSALFRTPSFSFGEWDNRGFCLSEDAQRFVQHCYDSGWVSGEIDWPNWKSTDEAQKLRNADEILSNASTEQLTMLLTVAVRQDRFVEGSLMGWFENGLLLAITQRASKLAGS